MRNQSRGPGSIYQGQARGQDQPGLAEIPASEGSQHGQGHESIECWDSQGAGRKFDGFDPYSNISIQV